MNLYRNHGLPPAAGPGRWSQVLREGLVAGTLASLLSTAVLAAAGRRDAGSLVAPVNAESHWLWGDESLREDRATWRHTAVGYLTHHLATVFWATLHAAVAGRRRGAASLPAVVLGGLATGAAAAAIDYTLVPKRLTPGFEHRLSRGSMVAAFAAIAAGVALGALLVRRRD